MPIGHGASLERRRLAAGKSAARLSGGVGGSGDVGQSDSVESTPARKASLLATAWCPYRKPTLVGGGKYPKVIERTLVKELGNLAP